MGKRLQGHVRNEVGAMIPSAMEVEHARELLSRYFRPTRLVSAESFAQHSGGRVHLKIESDLPTGSFKPRGALNALLTTAAQRPVSGVVASSTGNHGAAVAYAARIAKVSATIFLPEHPNPVKRARIVALGAKVIERGAMGESAAREGAAEFAREHGHYFLDDASDPLVPAGTATIAAEIFDEIPEPDVVFVPMGDTALIRGVAAEAKRRRSGVRIIGVQAEEAPAYVRSWQQGRVVFTDACDTIADGLASLRPLETNVIAIRELVDEVRLVSESELLDAIRILLLDEHVVAEASGAAATAAFLQDPSAYADAEIVILVTGANLSREVLRRAVT
ncbi:MAG TPA: pyridoxal-phosphate dependent enzyme [Candidatus Dormibacteraeota bacterium]|jgi:threonine dehydratase|nr:pyridoxal-phosphate dependent enzyme [Candidatus Dormibacteraeota bacterium]